MHDDLERLLADERMITPSARFLTSVMEAVEREANAPPALPFPWLPALPLFLATVTALAVAIREGLGSLRDPASIAVLGEQLRQFALLGADLGLQWVFLALAITAATVTLSLNQMHGRV